MVAFSRQDMIAKAPAWGAAALGALVALAVATASGASLDHAVEASGLASLVPVAAPPLGATARGLLALTAGGGVAAVVWAALYLVFGAGGAFAAPKASSDRVPAVRRADAHPDAPPRRPLTAAELDDVSAPTEWEEEDASSEFVPVTEPAERNLPADLDTPLAAFDPAAIPAAPREPVRPVAPLAPGERLQTFALAPPPPKAAAPAEPPSIEALLRRLEHGAERRVVRAR